jgi:hypothetical protein
MMPPMNGIRVRDLGFALLCFGFLWGCFLLALYKFGPKGNAFQQFIVDHNCVGTRIPERGYTEYHCTDPVYDTILYDMPKEDR